HGPHEVASRRLTEGCRRVSRRRQIAAADRRPRERGADWRRGAAGRRLPAPRPYFFSMAWISACEALITAAPSSTASAAVSTAKTSAPILMVAVAFPPASGFTSATCPITWPVLSFTDWPTVTSLAAALPPFAAA